MYGANYSLFLHTNTCPLQGQVGVNRDLPTFGRKSRKFLPLSRPDQ
jgi:hypothetical protein